MKEHTDSVGEERLSELALLAGLGLELKLVVDTCKRPSSA